MSGNNPIPGVQAYEGVRATNPPNVIKATRNPNSNDKKYAIGTLWVNTSGLDSFQLVGFSSGVPQWPSLGGGTVAVATLTGDSGGAISPSAGNINLLGTANQITSAGSGSTITFSLVGPYTPATYTAHGVLVGEGTSSIVALSVGTDGQVLTGNSAADPAFAAIGTKSGLTAHGVVLAEGASAFNATSAGSTGQVLKGVTSADPSFGNISEFNIVDDTTGTVASPNSLAASTTYIADQAAVTNGFLLPASGNRGDVIKIRGNGPGGWQIKQNANQAIKFSSQTSTTGIGGTVSSGNQYDCVELTCVVGGASTIWNISSYTGTLTIV